MYTAHYSYQVDCSSDMLCTSKKTNIWVNMKFTMRMRFACWKKISVCFLYPEICFLMKVSFITSVPVEFCGTLPATLGPKSVHLLIPTTILNHRTERGRMTVNAVHSKGQVGDYELESESVDLVASVLKIMSVMVHHHVPLPANSKKPISWGHCRRQPYGKIQHRQREGLGPDSSKFACWRES